jgi:hypothetical protein
MGKIIVSGATGFIGRRFVAALAARGDETTVLTRSPDTTPAPPGGRVQGWDPERAGDWYGAVDGASAVVHLAGERAVGARWTKAVKARIRDSRVQSTTRVVEAIAQANHKPEVFVSASAVGYYGDRSRTQPVDETAPAGSDFLAQVCAEWEAATEPARKLGVRVVNARIGIVLGPDGGALEEMAKPFRAFAGGPIGSGEQMVSWVSLKDVVHALLHMLDSPALRGPVNVVAPSAVSNAELSASIGAVLARPSWLRVPAFALRARFGEGADPLLTGQHALPKALQKSGYAFRHPELRGALEAALL